MAEKKTNINVTEENEMDLITGLLKAAEYKTEVSQTLNIQRNGQKLFKFDIRPLSLMKSLIAEREQQLICRIRVEHHFH